MIPVPEPSIQPSSAEADAVPRTFGYWTGHFVVVASMIGAGILTTSGFTLRDTGNPAALLGLWLLGGMMAWAGAVTVAELGTRLPRVGGDYVFVREGFGQIAGFVAGWATFVIGFIAPTAVVARLSASYLLSPFADSLTLMLPPPLGSSLSQGVATLIVLALTVVHSFGAQHSRRLQIGATLIKVTILLSLVGLGLIFGNGDWNHLRASTWPRADQWPALAVSLIYVGYAYAGWNGAAYLAGEIRQPARLLPKCLLGGAATVTIIYLAVNLTYIYALDPVQMMKFSSQQVEKVAELAIQHLFGDRVARVTSLLLGLGLLASISAYILTGPRVAYAMARDGAFPIWAACWHPHRQVPVTAIIIHGGSAIVLIWSGTFLELLDYASVGLAVASGLTVASVFPLRRRSDLPRPYSLPFYPWPPLLYLTLIIWTVGHMLTQPDRRLPAILSLATIGIAVPLSRRTRTKAPTSAVPQ